MRRREFLRLSTLSVLGALVDPGGSRGDARAVTLCLCGDVMTGRGLDQVLPHPGDPRLFEPHLRSARTYVGLAERANGAIAKPVDFAYPWGESLAEVRRVRPDAWIANLETAVTTSDERASKGIHYRMHPANAPCLAASGVDCWVLANNHVLDWGRSGLRETLETLRERGLRSAGAGLDAAQAQAPALLPVSGGGRVIVFSLGSVTSGIPEEWAAAEDRPGVNLLEGRSSAELLAGLRSAKRPGDVVVVSIHWGGNWGYAIARAQRELAHRLVDEAGVDVVHGHSSHHPKGIEIHRGRPILYGCGDFLNDYEGIGGHEEYRDDLVLLYFATVDPASGELVRLEMTPFRLARFRLARASESEVHRLQETLDRPCSELGTRVVVAAGGRLALEPR